MKLSKLLALVALAAPVQAQCEYAQLLSPDPVVDGDYGHALAIDGTWMAVGQTWADPLDSHVGAVHLYERLGGSWFFRQTLEAPEPGACRFGSNVAMEGDVLVVGAGDGCWVGAAWVYEHAGGVWSHAATLTSSNPFADDFGRSIAIGGGLVAVGDPGWPQEVALFEHGPLGWQEVAVVEKPSQENDSFGWALARAGGSLVVADQSYDAPAVNAGAVHVFEENAGVWTEVQRLQDSAPESFDWFGRAVRADGDLLAILSTRPTDEVAIFARSGGVWVEQDVVPASDASVVVEPNGLAVDGDTVITGEGHFDGTQGHARVLRDTGAGWGEVASIQPKDAGGGDGAGSAVALDGDHVLVAAIGFDDALDDVGAVTAHSLSAELCYTLEGYPKKISVSAGGTATLLLDATSAHAGEHFGVAGTLSGTSPGIPVGAFQAPLNPDAYFQLSLQAPSSVFENTVGTLDLQGKETAQVHVPSGLSPALAGLELHHAFLTIGSGGVTLVSNAWRHRLVP